MAASDLQGQVVGPASAEVRATAVIVFASWCEPCRNEIAMLGELLGEEPSLRVIGVNAYEEFSERSDAERLRAFLAMNAPWLQVVPATDRLMHALGNPSKVPTLFLFDRQGKLARSYLRARRAPPSKAELQEDLAALR